MRPFGCPRVPPPLAKGGPVREITSELALALRRPALRRQHSAVRHRRNAVRSSLYGRPNVSLRWLTGSAARRGFAPARSMGCCESFASEDYDAWARRRRVAAKWCGAVRSRKRPSASSSSLGRELDLVPTIHLPVAWRQISHSPAQFAGPQ